MNVFLNREMSKLYVRCSLGCTLPFAAFHLLVALHCSLKREVMLKLLGSAELWDSRMSCRRLQALLSVRSAACWKPFCLHGGVKKVRDRLQDFFFQMSEGAAVRVMSGFCSLKVRHGEGGACLH